MAFISNLILKICLSILSTLAILLLVDYFVLKDFFLNNLDDDFELQVQMHQFYSFLFIQN